MLIHRPGRKLSASIAVLFLLLSLGFFVYSLQKFTENSPKVSISTSETPPIKIVPKPSPEAKYDVHIDIKPSVTFGTAKIVSESSKVFAYAHGVAAADGKLFIGMAAFGGNTFPTDEVLIFDDKDISKPSIVRLKAAGDVTTMTYDLTNDKVYFVLSSNDALDIYSLDPHTYAVTEITSTSKIDSGNRPAIVTDGIYIYGITNTEHSSIFRVKIKGGELTVNSNKHIPYGHSAAIGIFGSTTELYFGGGMANGFEKADAVTLDPISQIKIEPCGMANDMLFEKASSLSGYVYIGCEFTPSGIRIDTKSMSSVGFSLPGSSFGLFKIGQDLYNAAQDGYIDTFPNFNLFDLRRFKVIDGTTTPLINGQNLEVNKILYAPESGKLYFTAWWGTKGLFEVSTSTNPVR